MEKDQEKHEIVVVNEHKPADDVKFGRNAASFLKDIIDSQEQKVIINGKQYIQFEGWQTIAKFYEHTVGIEWTKPIKSGNDILGWEARANVLNKSGLVVSSAESSCCIDEPKWKDRADFQRRSMSQTRAAAKALRNVFSWIIVLAGYAPTPFEEMDNIGEPKNVTPQPETKKSTHYKCERCKKENVTEGIKKFSATNFDGGVYCMDCQKIVKDNIVDVVL